MFRRTATTPTLGIGLRASCARELRSTLCRHDRPCAGHPRRPHGSSIERWLAHASFCFDRPVSPGVDGRHKAGHDDVDRPSCRAIEGFATRARRPGRTMLYCKESDHVNASGSTWAQVTEPRQYDLVMAGLVPAIHADRMARPSNVGSLTPVSASKNAVSPAWMAGTRPAMTTLQTLLQSDRRLCNPNSPPWTHHAVLRGIRSR